MSEQEKKRQRIYDLLNAETKLKFLCLLYTKQKKKKNFPKKRESWIEQKRKIGFLTALARVIKKAR